MAHHGAALFSHLSDLLRLYFYLLFYAFLLSLFTRITSALIIYDKITLFDIGHRYTNLLQDSLSTNPMVWPLEILWNTEVNKGHLNNPRRRKKHSGKRAGICNRLRERAHSTPRVFCSLMSNPWKIIWTILEPGLVFNGTLGTVTSFF